MPGDTRECAVGGGDADAGVDHKKHEVGRGDGGFRLLAHAIGDGPARGLFQAGGIDEADIGSKEVGEGPEVKVINVQAGDRFLLCTDGLSGVVGDDQLAEFITGQSDMQQCADALCQLALDQGSPDNISCVVIEVAESK